MEKQQQIKIGFTKNRFQIVTLAVKKKSLWVLCKWKSIVYQ